MRICSAIFGIFCSVVASCAEAHEWFPQECCEDRDCYKAIAGEVSVGPGGYYVLPDGTLISPIDPKVRFGNLTTDFYVCRSYKKMTNPVKCIFPPGAGV